MVLCDIHMSPVNGFEFMEKLRNHVHTGIRNTSIIFLTGDSKRDTVMFAKKNGPHGFLVKRISLNALKGKLESLPPPGNKLWALSAGPAAARQRRSAARRATSGRREPRPAPQNR